MFPTNKKTIAVYALLLGVAAAIVYYLLKKTKQTTVALIEEQKTVAAKKPTIKEKIAVAYDKGLATISEAQIKQYATWIDRIVQLLAISRKERKSQYGQPNEEALRNADALTKLNDDNLRAVANYWISVRGDTLSKALDMIVDHSQRLMELTVRLRELNLFKN